MDEFEPRLESVERASGAAESAACFECCKRSGALPGGFDSDLIVKQGGGETDRRMAGIQAK